MSKVRTGGQENDTSASVSNRMLAQVKAEIKLIVKHMRGENVRVFSCDVASTSARRVRRIEDIELVGGGGTDMRVGLAASAALRPRADIVIVATDGDTPWDDIPPDRNPQARYVTLLLDGDRDTVPPWMRKIIVAEPD
ncbi:VWA-like domain-containing protein [Micromonospora sp. CMU55-4]|uniref:VWA-like domain-containing protein n=1 Tax=Micromonospora sp. CMU55-4 TaxID=2717028 RepID=UPI00197BAAE6|nr:VWA-like domain-containing protein [Micromonospora sp. CMU55-4]